MTDPTPLPRARTFAALTAALALACSGNGDPEAPDGGVPAPGPATVAITGLSPQSGPVGTDVTIRAQGFAPGSTVEVGFGPPESEYEVIREATSDAHGRVAVSAEVPSWASSGEPYLFVVADLDSSPKAISDVFHVTERDGTLRIEGTITDEGVECLAMRGESRQLYSLVGRTTGLEPGDDVVVEGTVAEASFCMQGTTIEVQSVERR